MKHMQLEMVFIIRILGLDKKVLKQKDGEE